MIIAEQLEQQLKILRLDGNELRRLDAPALKDKLTRIALLGEKLAEENAALRWLCHSVVGEEIKAGDLVLYYECTVAPGVYSWIRAAAEGESVEVRHAP